MRVLRTIKDRYGTKAWTRYGFVDAFNPLTNWYDTDVIGIDMGITMVMAENARTGFRLGHVHEESGSAARHGARRISSRIRHCHLHPSRNPQRSKPLAIRLPLL